MNDLKFSNFNDKSNEGRMLLSALSILTCNKFNYKGNEINGSEHTPDEIFKILKNLSEDIYKDEIKKDNQLKEKSNDIIKSLENLKNNINNINKHGNCPNFEIREYISGLYNGYEIALSLIGNRKPDLKEVEHVALNDIFHTGFDINTDSVMIGKEDFIKENGNQIDDNYNEIPDKYGYKGFIKDVKSIINSNCIENYSNTPDFILAEFLINTLKSIEKLINNRDKWYSFNPWPKNIIGKDNSNITIGVEVKDLPIYDGIIDIIKEFSENDNITKETKDYFRNRFNELFNNVGDKKDDSKNNE